VKPNSSKGRYIQKAVVSSSMGPGIQVDPNLTREPAAN
jgi:large subunit ribosomal protein L1